MMGAVLQTHWRLALRTGGPWLTLALTVVLAVMASRGGATGKILFTFNEMAAPFFYLMAMLFTTAAARRERSERVDELIGALPYEVTPWVLGRFLVHYLIWLAISAAGWATAGAMVLLDGQPLDAARLALNWAAVAPVTLAFTTAVALAIGSLARQPVAAYFLAVGAWLAGPLSTLLLSRSSGWLPPPFGEYYASGRAFPFGASGLFYNADLLLYNRLFTLGLALCGLSAMLLFWARRRHRPWIRAALGLLLAAVLVAGPALGTQRTWAAWNDEVRAELNSLPDAGLLDRMPSYPVLTDGYDLDVSVEPAAHRLAIRGGFDVTNGGDSALPAIPLTLRSDFRIISLAVDGQPVAAERRGDSLVLPVPLASGETKRVTAAWEGEVWQWRLRDGPKLAAHVAEESILLPAHFGWYPLPGAQTLSLSLARCYELSAECQPAIRDQPVNHPPASFAVQVSGTDLHLLHNGQERTTGLYLVGTPWTETELHGLLVSASPDNRVQADRAAEEIARQIAAFEAMVPRRKGPVRLIQVHEAGYHGAPWAPTPGSGATPNALLLHGIDLARWWPGYFTEAYDQAVLALWWPSGGFTVEQERMYRGFTDYMSYVRTGQRPRYTEEVTEILLQVEQVAGREAALGILREMYGLLPAGPSPSEFRQAVERAAGGEVTYPGWLTAKEPEVAPLPTTGAADGMVAHPGPVEAADGTAGLVTPGEMGL